MGKYFTIQELCHSRTAIKQGIDNTPPPSAKVNLIALITNCLDPIRALWGGPVIVNSGFRTPMLNKAVGGAGQFSTYAGRSSRHYGRFTR